MPAIVFFLSCAVYDSLAGDSAKLNLRKGSMVLLKI